MSDIRRRPTRIRLFNADTVAASSGTVVSDVWNVAGPSFSLWIDPSAALQVDLTAYTGLNGGGMFKTQTVAAAVATKTVYSDTDLDINKDICKSLKVTITNAGASPATVTGELMVF